MRPLINIKDEKSHPGCEMRSLSLAAFSDFITFCLSKQDLGASPLAMLLSSLECHCVIISVPIVIDLLGVYFDVFLSKKDYHPYTGCVQRPPSAEDRTGLELHQRNQPAG